MKGLDGLTPDNLRNIAASLDLLSAVVLEVLPRITPQPEEREVLREWLEGTEQQDDLRAWADALERDTLLLERSERL